MEQETDISYKKKTKAERKKWWGLTIEYKCKDGKIPLNLSQWEEDRSIIEPHFSDEYLLAVFDYLKEIGMPKKMEEVFIMTPEQKVRRLPYEEIHNAFQDMIPKKEEKRDET